MVVMTVIMTPAIVRRAGADTLDVVVMAFLGETDLVLEAQHLHRGTCRSWQFITLPVPPSISWIRSRKVSTTSGWSFK